MGYPVKLSTCTSGAISDCRNSFLMKRVFNGNIILVPSRRMLTSRGLWCRRRRSQGGTVRPRVTSSSWRRGAKRSSCASRYPPSFATSPEKARGRWQNETFGLHSSICLGLTSVLWVEKRILGEVMAQRLLLDMIVSLLLLKFYLGLCSWLSLAIH